MRRRWILPLLAMTLLFTGCATSDRDKLLQYRDLASAARDAALAARQTNKIDAQTYLTIYRIDKQMLAVMNDVEAQIDLGKPIKRAIWSSLAKQLAAIDAMTLAGSTPAATTRRAHAGMSTIAAFELAMALLSAIRAAQLAGRDTIDPEAEAEIRRHEALSIARADEQAAKDAAEVGGGST